MSSFKQTFTSSSETEVLSTIKPQLMIGGLWRESEDKGTLPVIDPSTGNLLLEVADASPSDAIEALNAACNVQEDWAKWSPRDRADILRRAYERMTADTDLFATLMTLEMGKSIQEARGEVLYAAEFLRWYSEEAVRVSGRYQTSPSGKMQHLVSKKPVGPCLLITPWNFPLAMITRKVGPAIAAGCPMILKPASLTPLTACLFVSMMQDIGLPTGVLNLISTTKTNDVVTTLLSDTRLKKLSFTGSTKIGKHLLIGAAQNVLRTSMELGGNAPFIVFEDADIESAVDGAVQAKLRNIGQACTAANRFYVHASVADEFTEELKEKFSSISLGRGISESEVMGPMISESARADVHSMVMDAVADGAKIITGGSIPKGSGYFYPPTILVDVKADSRVMKDEIFGPIAPIYTFKSELEAIELANDSELGLAGYIYTRDLDRSLRVKSILEVGMLGINVGIISDPAAPFGGVKQSGLGREGGSEGIEEYLDTQYTAVGVSA